MPDTAVGKLGGGAVVSDNSCCLKRNPDTQKVAFSFEFTPLLRTSSENNKANWVMGNSGDGWFTH